jgi:hypothetical protein
VDGRCESHLTWIQCFALKLSGSRRLQRLRRALRRRHPNGCRPLPILHRQAHERSHAQDIRKASCRARSGPSLPGIPNSLYGVCLSSISAAILPHFFPKMKAFTTPSLNLPPLPTPLSRNSTALHPTTSSTSTTWGYSIWSSPWRHNMTPQSRFTTTSRTDTSIWRERAWQVMACWRILVYSLYRLW